MAELAEVVGAPAEEVSLPPAAIVETPLRPGMTCATRESVVVPLPSWPEELAPQHATAPPVERAHP
jgi:hypothetical protein